MLSFDSAFDVHVHCFTGRANLHGSVYIMCIVNSKTTLLAEYNSVSKRTVVGRPVASSSIVLL